MPLPAHEFDRLTMASFRAMSEATRAATVERMSTEQLGAWMDRACPTARGSIMRANARANARPSTAPSGQPQPSGLTLVGAPAKPKPGLTLAQMAAIDVARQAKPPATGFTLEQMRSLHAKPKPTGLSLAQLAAINHTTPKPAPGFGSPEHVSAVYSARKQRA